MQIEFTKMHGLGNDFVVIDATQQPTPLTPEQIRSLADRHSGIGCDQVLVIETPGDPTADFRYRIFNGDGHEVEACGNGARCFARYVFERGLTDKRELTLETLGGPLYTRYEDNGMITVDMGVPRFEPHEIPFTAGERALTYPLQTNGACYEISALSVGNPHAVLLVDDVDSAPVTRLGPLIESHECFPQRVNVGFLEIRDRGHARLRVYERGAGETLACGSGACAAMVAARSRDLVNGCCAISLRGGDLSIAWSGPGSSVMMTGPATFVFRGTIDV